MPFFLRVSKIRKMSGRRIVQLPIVAQRCPYLTRRNLSCQRARSADQCNSMEVHGGMARAHLLGSSTLEYGEILTGGNCGHEVRIVYSPAREPLGTFLLLRMNGIGNFVP